MGTDLAIPAIAAANRPYAVSADFAANNSLLRGDLITPFFQWSAGPNTNVRFTISYELQRA